MCSFQCCHRDLRAVAQLSERRIVARAEGEENGEWGFAADCMGLNEKGSASCAGKSCRKRSRNEDSKFVRG